MYIEEIVYYISIVITGIIGIIAALNSHPWLAFLMFIGPHVGLFVFAIIDTVYMDLRDNTFSFR